MLGQLPTECIHPWYLGRLRKTYAAPVNRGSEMYAHMSLAKARRQAVSLGMFDLLVMLSIVLTTRPAFICQNCQASSDDQFNLNQVNAHDWHVFNHANRHGLFHTRNMIQAATDMSAAVLWHASAGGLSSTANT